MDYLGVQRVCWLPHLKLLGEGPGPPLPTPMCTVCHYVCTAWAQLYAFDWYPNSEATYGKALVLGQVAV